MLKVLQVAGCAEFDHYLLPFDRWSLMVLLTGSCCPSLAISAALAMTVGLMSVFLYR
jgi:hypothetical protein